MGDPGTIHNDYKSLEQINAYCNMHMQTAYFAKYAIGAIEEFREKKQIKSKYEHLVDVGCGHGSVTIEMSKYYPRTTGFDSSEVMILTAKQEEKLNPHGIEFGVAAAEKIPLEDSSVDVITSILAAHNFNMDDFLNECNRILKPEGVVILLTFTHENVVPVDKSIVKPGANPDGTKLMKKMVDQLKNYAIELSHLESNVLDGYHKLYEKLQRKGFNKSRDDSKTFPYAIMTGSEMRNYANGVEFYNLPKSRKIIESLTTNMKKQWGIEHISDEDFKVSILHRMNVITLSRI